MSPSVLVARSIAWWLATFAKRCDCPPLDVRPEGKRVECGRCGKAIEVRA
jgi:hypothetical protein